MKTRIRITRGWQVITIFVVLVTALVGTGMWIERACCQDVWRDSGMRSRFMHECMVETKPGHWIPAKNYREDDAK